LEQFPGSGAFLQLASVFTSEFQHHSILALGTKGINGYGVKGDQDIEFNDPP